MFGHNDPHHDDDSHAAPVADASLTDDDQGLGTPKINSDDTAAGNFIDDVPAPASPPAVTLPDTDAVTGTSDDSTAVPAVSASGEEPDTDKLLDIKQQALQQLTPLVGHLEQSPEEKFRTTMMMIQASDNHELIQTAYEAAQQIGDEKARAQALLDIVNEINYFTHNSDSVGGSTSTNEAA